MCLDSVYARGFADCYVNATGPQRPVEPARPHPLCTAVHGHSMGKMSLKEFCKEYVADFYLDKDKCL